MNTERRELERWLAAEESGGDDAADAALAQLFAAVPKVEATPAFVNHAVSSAWRWRARRRRAVVFGWAAAVLLICVGMVVFYLASPSLARVAVKVLAFASGRAVPWLIAYATVAMKGWLTLGHVGTVVAAALITPGRTVAVVGVELVGILAFFALQRIAGAARLGDA